MCIKEMSDDMLQSADLDFSTSGVTGQEVQLNPKYNKITPDNRQEYVRSAIKYRYGIISVRSAIKYRYSIISIPANVSFLYDFQFYVKLIIRGSKKIPSNIGSNQSGMFKASQRTFFISLAIVRKQISFAFYQITNNQQINSFLFMFHLI